MAWKKRADFSIVWKTFFHGVENPDGGAAHLLLGAYPSQLERRRAMPKSESLVPPPRNFSNTPPMCKGVTVIPSLSRDLNPDPAGKPKWRGRDVSTRLRARFRRGTQARDGSRLPARISRREQPDQDRNRAVSPSSRIMVVITSIVWLL